MPRSIHEQSYELKAEVDKSLPADVIDRAEWRVPEEQAVAIGLNRTSIAASAPMPGLAELNGALPSPGHLGAPCSEQSVARPGR